MKTEDVAEALRRAYDQQSSAIVFEVTDSLGNARKTGRQADAIAVTFWESRGLETLGFEIKVSRSDWQRELQMPAKADAHFVRCDRWHLVTPKRKGHETPIAQPSEIPGPWGWLEITDKGAVEVRKKAPKLVPSVQFDKRFAFALIRAAAKMDGKAISKEVDRRVKAAETEFTERVNAAAARLVRPDVDIDEPLMKALREAFGPSLNWLGKPDVVEAIKQFRAITGTRRYQKFDEVAADLRTAADQIERAALAFQAAATTETKDA